MIRDLEGTDLPDLAAARHEARRSARGLAIDEIRSDGEIDESAVVIADETGKTMETMSVAEVIAIPDV
ncbi:MAG: hypothetical protein H0U98_05365 [Alphaproteobacteria bacterium]|nr:hypothetical protein [Alphaproteobacteria bacterium]